MAIDRQATAENRGVKVIWEEAGDEVTLDVLFDGFRPVRGAGRSRDEALKMIFGFDVREVKVRPASSGWIVDVRDYHRNTVVTIPFECSGDVAEMLGVATAVNFFAYWFPQEGSS